MSSNAGTSSIDDLKAKYGQLRAEKVSLQAQLDSLRELPDPKLPFRSALELENDELGQLLRGIEEKAILYRSAAWTCFEIDLDVGRRARSARQSDQGSAAAADKDGNLGLGIRFDTFWRGRFYEPYYLVFARPSQLLETPQLTSTAAGDVEASSLSDSLRLLRHTIPHFVPLERLVEKYLPSVLGGALSGGAASSIKDPEAGGLLMLSQFTQLPGVHAFLSDLHSHLQAYISRRQQTTALQQLRLPGPSHDVPDQPSGLEALGTEAFDLVKVTWHLPSTKSVEASNDRPAASPDVDDETTPSSAVLAAIKRKRAANADELTKSLQVLVHYPDLHSDRLIDDTRPTGTFAPNDPPKPDGLDPFEGVKFPYGQVRIEVLEYPPEKKTRERRTPGVSRADIRALQPKITRRQDLEELYAQQEDGESKDLDEAFQTVAEELWKQETDSTASTPIFPPTWEQEWRTATTLLRRRLRARVDPGIYRHKSPDFRQLARLYPDTFGKFVKDQGGWEAKLDFQDAEAVRSLAQTLLSHNFGVHAVLSPSNLCPMIPNRLSYIALIRDILAWTLPTQELLSQTRRLSPSEQKPTATPRGLAKEDVTIRGLDIGTGASAIYPVLGCACFPTWTWTATDIDATSLEYAQQHIVSHPLNNGQPQTLDLARRIHVVHTKQDDALLPAKTRDSTGSEETKGEREKNDSSCFEPDLHFTMCNPPFYSSDQEMQESALFKKEPPSAVCHGTASEMVTAGGEVHFIKRMIQESAAEESRGKVTWWTSMVGKLNSLPVLVEELKIRRIDSYGLHELNLGGRGGGRTKRWALIWTVGTGLRLSNDLARSAKSSLLERCWPLSTERSRLLTLGPSITRREVYTAAESILDQLDECHTFSVPALVETGKNQGGGHSLEVVLCAESWTRRARRQRQRRRGDVAIRPNPGKNEATVGLKPILIARMTVVERRGQPLPATSRESKQPVSSMAEHEEDISLGLEVKISWMFGHDRIQFESFAMYLLGAIEKQLQSLLATDAPRNE